MGRSRLAILFGTFVVASIVLAGCKRVKPSEVQSDAKGDRKDRGGGLADDAAKERSKNNLKMIGLAMHNYASDRGYFPPAGPKPGTNPSPVPVYGIHGWRVQILPFLEQEALFKEINPTSPVPASVKTTSVATYRSPLAGSTSSQTPYRVFVGNGAAFEYGKTLNVSDISDGLPNTIFVVEAAEAVDWADGPDLAYDPAKPLPPLGIFPGGFHALMGDGSVRWFDTGKVDEKVIRALITRNGGEVNLP